MGRPERPARDDYDNNYQISPHFVRTPGLTDIPEKHRNGAVNTNYVINLTLKREVRALYGNHGLDRCPNHGLYYAGYPQWTMIEDRTKTVLLVVELKMKDITRWWNIHADMLKILDRSGLAARGVCVRYYRFSPARAQEALDEQKKAEDIRARESAAVDGDDEGTHRATRIRIPIPRARMRRRRTPQHGHLVPLGDFTTSRQDGDNVEPGTQSYGMELRGHAESPMQPPPTQESLYLGFMNQMRNELGDPSDPLQPPSLQYDSPPTLDSDSLPDLEPAFDYFASYQLGIGRFRPLER